MRTCNWMPRFGEDPCPNRCEGSTDYCAHHNRLKRKEIENARKESEKRTLKLSASKPKRTAIPKVSEKRKVQNQEYFKLVEQFKKDNPECKAKINEYCTKATDDPHHSKGRGKFLLDVSSWIPVCRSCHNFIEQHPSEAQKRGLSFSRLATNQTICQQDTQPE